jgi:hypothetical protein
VATSSKLASRPRRKRTDASGSDTNFLLRDSKDNELGPALERYLLYGYSYEYMAYAARLDATAESSVHRTRLSCKNNVLAAQYHVFYLNMSTYLFVQEYLGPTNEHVVSTGSDYGLPFEREIVVWITPAFAPRV